MSKTNQDNYIAHARKDGTNQSVISHLQGVSAKSRIFGAKIGLGDYGALVGLLHDLGKFSQEFQSYIQSAVGLLNPDEDEEYVDASGLKGKIDHSTAGAQYIRQQFKGKDTPAEKFLEQILTLCIVSHHSGLIDCLKPSGENNWERRIQKDDKKTHLIEVTEKADPEIFREVQRILDSEDLLIPLKKVIASIQKYNQSRQTRAIQEGLLVRFLFSCLIDGDRIDSADFENPKAALRCYNGSYPQWDLLIERLEKYLENIPIQNRIDEIRRKISQGCFESAQRGKGIFTLTVPTGGGKTLASLRFGLHHAKKHHLDRIIFVIPFTTIIDQNAETVRNILDPTSDNVEPSLIVLEHHSNLTPEEQTWKAKILTENWDAPVIYTTSVQLLESLFSGGTRGARRLHQLANSLIIFDEIQTLPIRCIHLFNNAVNFLVEQCGSTVVLCTATQPLLNQVEPTKGMMKYDDRNEIMSDVRSLFDDLKRVEVLNYTRSIGWTNEEIAKLALDQISQANSCLVIVNTKQMAQALFQLCKAPSMFPVFHLSTAMCPAHRLVILNQIRAMLERGDPVLCISTQLIEAGVDLDFNSVIRCSAGLDSIAQAAGRCNRNGRIKVGRVYVVNAAQENIKSLEDISTGQKHTDRILREFESSPSLLGNSLLSPSAMQRYYQYNFFDRRGEMDYPIGDQSSGYIGRSDRLLNLLGENSISVSEHKRTKDCAPAIFLRHSFMSAGKEFKAMDISTQGVIVPYGKEGEALVTELCGAFQVEKQFELLRKAQRYTVNLYPNLILKFSQEGAMQEIQKSTGIYYLDKQYYSDDFGISLEMVNSMSFINC